MRSPSVVVGWHDWGMVSGFFTYSLARAVAFEGGRVKACLRQPSPYTEEARNKIVETFLALPQGADYLLMVDADIEFERDAISKTMWVAQNFDADVVWGNYALGTFSNSVFTKDGESELAVAMENLQPNMVYHNTYAGGTGWCLMKKSLLEKMRDTYPGPWHWFERDLVDDVNGKVVKMGEDLSFGRRVWKMGGKQISYTGIFLVHHKNTPTIPGFMAPIAAEMGSPMQEVGIARPPAAPEKVD